MNQNTQHVESPTSNLAQDALRLGIDIAVFTGCGALMWAVGGLVLGWHDRLVILTTILLTVVLLSFFRASVPKPVPYLEIVVVLQALAFHIWRGGSRMAPSVKIGWTVALLLLPLASHGLGRLVRRRRERAATGGHS